MTLFRKLDSIQRQRSQSLRALFESVNDYQGNSRGQSDPSLRAVSQRWRQESSRPFAGCFEWSDLMERKPVTQDPSLEEIWGTDTLMGMAEMIRLERPDHPENRGLYRAPMIRECSTRMLPGGRGVLRGQG